MRNVWLIACREYLERVRTKAFLVSVLLFPLILTLAFGVPAYFASRHTPGTAHVDVVSADPALGTAFANAMQANGAASKTSITVLAPSKDLRAMLDAAVDAHKISGYLWIPDTSDTQAEPEYISGSAGDLQKIAAMQGALRQAKMHEALEQSGLPPQQIERLLAPVSIHAVQRTSGKTSSGAGTYIASLVLMFLLYGSLMGQGFAVSRSIIEEKNSRVFEVMLAIVTPEEMLAGKLLGVGAVGLTQTALWLLAGLIFSAPGLAAVDASSGLHLHLAPEAMVAFVICYVLGFFFYSALSATLGSMVSSEQELQQLNLLITLPLILCIVFFNVVLRDPSGTLATVLSLLPPFAPLLMYLRIAVQTPPAWQIGLSLALMLGGVWAAIWLAARIYRVGVLMYGKRPTLPELLRWLHYR